MVRFASAVATLFSFPSLATSSTECAPDIADPVSMLQIERLHITSRRQFIQKQPPEQQSRIEGEATILDDTSRTPFLPSDYVIDGNNDNYLQDMEERVAADAAAQPAMWNHTLHSSGDSSHVSEKEGEAESDGGSADTNAHDSGSKRNAKVAAESDDASADDSIVERGSERRDNGADTTNVGALVNSPAAPIVSDVNSSLDNFGNNLYVMSNLSGLVGFGTPLEPVDGFDGNFVVDSNDPMGWRDYRPTEAPWPFDTPKKDTAVEVSSPASDGASYDEWDDYIHDDDNELDERDPDEVYKSMTHPLQAATAAAAAAVR